MIGHLVIVGVGLIGGSVARALKKGRHVRYITGVGRSEESLRRALGLGVVDAVSTDVAASVRDADMVLVAVPMGEYASVFARMAGTLPQHAVVTDAGSTKQEAVNDARRWLANAGRFVPAHPIAGKERSGVEAASETLFQNHLCILTPDAGTDPEALDAVRSMWEACGCRLESMSAAEHDDFLAGVSHLPHVLAFALVNAVRKSGGRDPFRYAAGGFRDFTRIASSSPVMWRDIALSNRQAILGKLSLLEAELKDIRVALEVSDGDWLLDEFAAAKQARDAWLAAKGGCT